MCGRTRDLDETSTAALMLPRVPPSTATEAQDSLLDLKAVCDVVQIAKMEAYEKVRINVFPITNNWIHNDSAALLEQSI